MLFKSQRRLENIGLPVSGLIGINGICVTTCQSVHRQGLTVSDERVHSAVCRIRDRDHVNSSTLADLEKTGHGLLGRLADYREPIAGLPTALGVESQQHGAELQNSRLSDWCTGGGGGDSNT